MAYSKTTWAETTARSLANLNNLETQYDEAIADAITLRADNSEELRVETAASVPSAGTAGRLLFNTTDSVLYYDTGSVWKALPGTVFEAGTEDAGRTLYYTEFPGDPTEGYMLEVTNTTVAKKAEFTIAMRGTYRVSFGIRSSGGETIYMRIYKNGVAYGTQRSTAQMSGTTYTEDLSFEVGDTCQLYGYVSSLKGYLYNYCLKVSEAPYY